MAKLPRFTATTPPPRESGLARATDIGALTRTGDIEVWRGVSRLGGAMQDVSGVGFQTYMDRQSLDDQATMGEISKRAQDANTEATNTVNMFDPSVGSALPDNPKEYYDGTKLNRFDNPQKEKFINTTYKDYEAKILNLAKGIRNPKTRQAWINSQLPNGYKNIKDAATLKHQEYQEELILGNARTAASNGDIELSNKWLDIAEKYGLIGPKRAEIERVNNQAIHKKGVIENIKPLLINTVENTGDKEDGYKVLDAATKQLVKDGILTEPEAAEANKKLGDWMDNYVSGRIKAGKDNKTAETRQLYQDFSESILEGKLTYDDIEQSVLLKADKGKWLGDDNNKGYIKGSYKNAPTENTPEGHRVSFNAVYNVATLQLSPKEGYDALLDARFNKRSITNEQFRWAVDKIENPYPQHVLEDLGAVLKSNLENYNRLFKFDNERNRKVNESLISWVDGLIKQDKIPPFDFKKKMEGMSSAFRVGGGQPYDIGRIIEQGGMQWEIVGFDENGEPLVEAVP